MNWRVMFMPRSANCLLSRARAKGFSKTQTLLAILDWFATLPLEARMRVAHRYVQGPAAPEEGRGGGAADPEAPAAVGRPAFPGGTA